MNARPGPIAIYFFDRLRDLALAAGGEEWRQSGSASDSVVTGPEDPPPDADESTRAEFGYYGGQLVGESIGPAKARYIAFMSPKVALAIAEQMLVAADSPLTIEQARVIQIWRVELECSYGRIGELAAQVWGKESGAPSGANLCTDAERLLGTDFDHETTDR